MLSNLDTVKRIHFGEGYLCTDAHHTSSHVTRISQQRKALEQHLSRQTVLVHSHRRASSCKCQKTSHFLVPRCFPLIATSPFSRFCMLQGQRERERETDTVDGNRERRRTLMNSCKVLYFSWVINARVSSCDFACTFSRLTNHPLFWGLFLILLRLMARKMSQKTPQLKKKDLQPINYRMDVLFQASVFMDSKCS